MALRTIEPSRAARCRGESASLAALLATVLLACPACENGSPASPTFLTLGTFAPPSTIADGGPIDATLIDARPEAGGDASIAKRYALCPDAMAPTFPSIVSELLAGYSCGSLQN